MSLFSFVFDQQFRTEYYYSDGQFCVLISEPFDRSNTASAVFDPFTFQRILRVFRRSHEELSRTRDVNVILSTVM